MKFYILMVLGLSTSIYADMSRNNNSVVTDSVTKLQWQDNINPYDTQKEIQLSAATVQCEDLTLDGHDDWRLPNINELASIVDDTKYNFALPSIFTSHTNNENDHSGYWSSTTSGRLTHKAWIIRFDSGEQVIFESSKYGSHYTRCVRSL